MILFLDLDSIRELWRLMAVLRHSPDTQVVISGATERKRHLDALRDLFAPSATDGTGIDLRRCIVGVTPTIPISDSSGRAGSRYREILLYLNDRPSADWIALDADASLFPPNCPNLSLCERGFDVAEAMSFHAKLASVVDPKRLALRDSVPVIERDGKAAYVCLRDIPRSWQYSFRAVLDAFGRPMIQIDGVGKCADASDWQDWLDGQYPQWEKR